MSCKGLLLWHILPSKTKTWYLILYNFDHIKTKVIQTTLANGTVLSKSSPGKIPCPLISHLQYLSMIKNDGVNCDFGSSSFRVPTNFSIFQIPTVFINIIFLLGLLKESSLININHSVIIGYTDNTTTRVMKMFLYFQSLLHKTKTIMNWGFTKTLHLQMKFS